MKNNNTISAALATFNEEKNITECIKSLKLFADEVVVVDGSSQDKTREIAAKLGAAVIKTTNKPMFHINKNMAIDNCTSKWIFLIDADERVTEELAQEIKKIASSNLPQNGFWINRRNWFLGGYLKKGGAYPDPVIRLFKNGSGRLPEISVHEQVKIKGEVGKLNNDLLHFADPNFKRYLQRSLTYTTQTALKLEREKVEPNLKNAAKYMFLMPLWTFFKIYIRHKGFQDGFRGFIWAFFSSIHYYYSYLKVFENHIKNSKNPN